MKPFEVGERVAWTVRDHGKDKRIQGKFVGADGTVASVDVETPSRIKRMTTVLARLNRCRGRKPGQTAKASE